MQDRTAVIAVEMRPSDPAYMGFKEKSAIDKIDIIAERIEAAYLEIQKKHPDTAVIAAWEEYGITEPYSIYVDIYVKDYLQQKMQELVKKLPLLTVYAGTVAVERPLEATEQKAKTEDEKLGRHLKYYEHPAVKKIQEEEQAFRWWQNQHTHLQKNKISQLKRNKTRTHKVKVVSNTFYSFRNIKGAVVGKKRRKMAAFKETIAPSQIYRPGSLKTGDPYLTETHPVSGKEYDVYVDLCYEHIFSHLKERKEAKKPKFQFIFSSSIMLDVDQLIGEHVIHFDPELSPGHIVMSDDLQNNDVDVYQLNILEEKPELRGPLRPFIPVEVQINSLIRRHAYDIKDLLAWFGNIYSMSLKDLIVEFAKIKKEFSGFYALYSGVIENVLAKNNERELRDFALSIIKELQSAIEILKTIQLEFAEHISKSQVEGEIYKFPKIIEETCVQADGKSKITKLFSRLFAEPTKIDKGLLINMLSEKITAMLQDHQKDPNRQFLNSKKDAPVGEVVERKKEFDGP